MQRERHARQPAPRTQLAYAAACDPLGAQRPTAAIAVAATAVLAASAEQADQRDARVPQPRADVADRRPLLAGPLQEREQPARRRTRRAAHNERWCERV